MRTLGLMALVLSLALPAHADVFFGVKSQNPIEVGSSETDSTTPARMFSFTEVDFQDLGVANVGGTRIDVDGLALAPNGLLFGFDIGASGADQSSHLVQFVPNTANAMRIGSELEDREIRGAMFDGSGRLWAIDAAADRLLRIDPATGAVLADIALSQPVSTVTDIAQTPDGTVYLVDIVGTTTQNFFRLDLGTGLLLPAHTDLAPDDEGAIPRPTPALTGLAADSGGDLIGIGVNGTDDLYRYALPGFVRTEFLSNLLGSFNAGRGDLASFVAVNVPVAGSLALVLGGLLAWSLSAFFTVHRRSRARSNNNAFEHSSLSPVA